MSQQECQAAVPAGICETEGKPVDKQQIANLLMEIGGTGTFEHPHPVTGAPLPMRCLVLPQLSWEPDFLVKSLEHPLPPDLEYLWDATSGLVLFQDMTYRQYGLVLWSPDQAVVRHQRHASERFADTGDLQDGDFIIGEFLGDLDLVIIRCDPQFADFGSIVIAQEIDPRPEWPTAASSLGEFLQRFLQSNQATFGEKYWVNQQ
jgi:hypothetical protein